MHRIGSLIVVFGLVGLCGAQQKPVPDLGSTSETRSVIRPQLGYSPRAFSYKHFYQFRTSEPTEFLYHFLPVSGPTQRVDSVAFRIDGERVSPVILAQTPGWTLLRTPVGGKMQFEIELEANGLFWNSQLVSPTEGAGPEPISPELDKIFRKANGCVSVLKPKWKPFLQEIGLDALDGSDLIGATNQVFSVMEKQFTYEARNKGNVVEQLITTRKASCVGLNMFLGSALEEAGFSAVELCGIETTGGIGHVQTGVKHPEWDFMLHTDATLFNDAKKDPGGFFSSRPPMLVMGIGADFTFHDKETGARLTFGNPYGSMIAANASGRLIAKGQGAKVPSSD